MLSLYKKKDPFAPKVTAWAYSTYKLKALADLANKDSSLYILCWFEETLENMTLLLSNPDQANLVSRAQHQSLSAYKIIFAEHYPLFSKEHALFKKLNIEQPQVYAALDEPMFMHFGGEKILALLKQLGMKDDEPFNNSLLYGSIKKAQQKFDSLVQHETNALSQKEWMEKNIPKK